MTVTPRGHGIFGPGPLSLGQFSCRPGRMVAGAPCPHSTTKRRSLRADRYPRGRSWPVTTARRLLPSRLATLLVPSPLLAQQRWLATNPCARLPPPEHRAHLPSGPPRRHPLDRRQPRHAHDCLQGSPGARRSEHPGLLSCSLAGSTDAEGGEPPGHCGSALARRVPLRGGGQTRVLGTVRVKLERRQVSTIRNDQAQQPRPYWPLGDCPGTGGADGHRCREVRRDGTAGLVGRWIRLPPKGAQSSRRGRPQALIALDRGLGWDASSTP